MGGANGASDNICMGMTDTDNNEKVAVVRLQPAINGHYYGLNTNAYNRNGWRRRRKRFPSLSPEPESNGIICQEECVITKGPATACYNAGGGCGVVNGECAANLDQPEAACDGTWCEPKRVCT
ncbi:hypothetical protein PHBOTO_001596 [Pseudozyma hubeiensis]|nr:hypothetical protein PHBOTO_001596 [Pseudozyma hubeiensis]